MHHFCLFYLFILLCPILSTIELMYTYLSNTELNSYCIKKYEENYIIPFFFVDKMKIFRDVKQSKLKA